jgi:alpha-L-fucosidase 2
MIWRPLLLLPIGLLPLGSVGTAQPAGGHAAAQGYAVTWETLGKGHRDSMPIGNGDIGANVWTEQNGDLVLLIGKTDAWSENGELDKVGQVRVRLTPNPFVGAPRFRQVLDVQKSAMEIESGDGATVRVWVDANRPVIHVEYGGARPLEVKASVELWRTERRILARRARRCDRLCGGLAGVRAQ